MNLIILHIYEVYFVKRCSYLLHIYFQLLDLKGLLIFCTMLHMVAHFLFFYVDYILVHYLRLHIKRQMTLTVTII